MFNINWQIDRCSHPDQVEVLIQQDNGERSTGEKSNILIRNAKGAATARVDDDDMIWDGYIQRGIDFALSGMDCASLTGLYFKDGIFDRPFVHSLKYAEWSQDDSFYYRCPNHLNFVRRDLVKGIPYPDKTTGEDHDWSKAVLAAGILKTEFEIKEALYLYYARSKK